MEQAGKNNLNTQNKPRAKIQLAGGLFCVRVGLCNQTCRIAAKYRTTAMRVRHNMQVKKQLPSKSLLPDDFSGCVHPVDWAAVQSDV